MLGLLSYDCKGITNTETGLAIAGLVLTGAYGHLILPWIRHEKFLREKLKKEEEHIRDQEKWRSFYTKLNEKYSLASIPKESSSALIDYKNEMTRDITVLEQAADFLWDDTQEQKRVVKLLEFLKDQEVATSAHIGLKVGKEIETSYKPEVALIQPDMSTVNVDQLTKIVYEKFGDVAYKFTSYKNVLDESIARCKQIGASPDTLNALENLNRATNRLFSKMLDQERKQLEETRKQDELFKVDIDTKIAAKDLCVQAKHHVSEATDTVARMSKKVDKALEAQRKELNSCSILLEHIKGLFSIFNAKQEQQTDRVIQEVGQTQKIIKDNYKIIEGKLTKIEQKKDQEQASQLGNPPPYTPGNSQIGNHPPYAPSVQENGVACPPAYDQANLPHASAPPYPSQQK